MNRTVVAWMVGLVLLGSGIGARAGLPAELEFPAKPAAGSYVVDEAGLLQPEDLAEVERIARETLSETAAPIVVVALRSKADYSASGVPIEQYARALFDHWGIGHPTVETAQGSVSRNIGVLLLVFVAERQARIELGADWGTRMDDDCAEIMAKHIIAPFRRGEFSRGIVSGVEALAAMVRYEPLPSPPRPSWFWPVILGALGLGLFSVISLVRSGSNGMAWVFWGIIFSILSFILYASLTRGRGRFGGFRGGGFGGGFSGGGGATGSW